MHAVEYGRINMVYFSPVEFPEALRREITAGGEAEILDDVQVVHPGGPKEVYRPTYVLCASLSDPTHYEFIDRCEVDPTRQRIADTAFRVIDSVEDWWKFLELQAETQARMANITGVEATDWPEDFD